MREAIVELLRCPECGATLNLRIDAWSGDHVMKGLLDCTGCERAFPVVRGVPRLLSDALRNELTGGDFNALQHRTQRSFGYQWIRFGELRPEFEAQFLWFISPPITRAVDMRRCFTWSGVRMRVRLSISATTPDTIAVENDVPDPRA
jgi:uncharacterized protein YbaR (Trm112 family)